jgi:hypothetical protein
MSGCVGAGMAPYRDPERLWWTRDVVPSLALGWSHATAAQLEVVRPTPLAGDTRTVGPYEFAMF